MFNQNDVDNSRLKFAGFKVSSEERVRLRQKLQDILEKYPSDSRALLHVRKKEGFYNVFIEIKSSKISFRGSARARNFESSIEDAFKWISLQLEHWRKERWSAQVEKFNRIQALHFAASEQSYERLNGRPKAG